MSVIDDDNGFVNTPEYTVSELSGAVKRTVEDSFSYVRVRGEVGRVSRPASGHLYLDLKDDRAVLAGVIWKGRAASLAHRPEEGMEVIATGRLTTFPGQSKYQITIDKIEPAGEGALMAMLEKRKKLLASEGLFANECKKNLPFLPATIGVVTSPSGSVIRDILHRLRDRFPRHVLVWPVAVQGQASASQVARAIEGFNALKPDSALPRPDVIIVARGGGSLEDLWGFNEEAVARAAAASDIPLISAVGHETDTTLIDYVADRRAPTPTAAAELAVPVRVDLLAWVNEQGQRVQQSVARNLDHAGRRLRDLSRALPREDALLAPQRQRLDHLSGRLPRALRANAAVQKTNLAGATARFRPSLLKTMIDRENNRLQAFEQRNKQGLFVSARRDQLSFQSLAKRMERINVVQPLALRRSRVDEVWSRATASVMQKTNRLTAELASLERTRQNLGYKETLKRGFSVVRSGTTILSSVTDAANAARMELEFADGRLQVSPIASAPMKKRAPAKKDEQGDLF